MSDLWTGLWEAHEYS